MKTQHNLIHQQVHMKIMLLILTTIGSLLGNSMVQADIYKQEQSDGSVLFTDQPTKDKAREKVELQPTAIIPSVDTQHIQYSSPNQTTKIQYSLTIQSPSHGSTFRNEQANAIPLDITVTPSIRSPYTLLITLDGQSVHPQTTSLPILYRGEHTIKASVINKAGQTITSSTSTFFVHRFSGGS